MGCSSSSDAGGAAEAATSKQIDQANLQAYDEDAERLKLLLLGTGESGKSTIFKQMRILYGTGYDRADLLAHRKYVWGNMIEAIAALLEACADRGRTGELVHTEDARLIEDLGDVNDKPMAEITSEVGAAVARLWSEQVIQELWRERSTVQVFEMSKHFLTRAEEIANEDYVPTREDLLYTRVRTTGIVEEEFTIDGSVFVFYDVGGQRNERKKWLHCFDGVNAVIYVVALSEFDQTLFEDTHTNRMIEALTTFQMLINTPFFRTTPVMLFLNKKDLFEEKVKTVNIASVSEFADYNGAPHSFEDGVVYFRDKFLELNQARGREIFYHTTTAVDTSNVSFVFGSCREIILRENLEANGMCT